MRIDGLTPRTLQASSRSWWDDLFSRLLLNALPLDTRELVELDCGAAAAAHILLPSLPEARYLGVDRDPTRLVAARSELEHAPIAGRVQLRLADPSRLPLEPDSCDVVLSLFALQQLPHVPEVLREALRVLRSAGRLIAFEPDNLGQRFYFDGVLEEISHVMHNLCLRARVERQPADFALGPRLPAILREAGYHDVRLQAHLVQSSRMETASAFFHRLQRIALAVAREAGIEREEELLGACEQAIKRSLFAGMPKRLGYSCHTVPVFLCVGVKP